MSNPINGVSQSNPTVGNNQPKARGEGQKSTGASASPSQDAVSLTSTAEALQALERSLNASETLSTEKVESIKAALKDGSYQINPELIAEKFIEVERALGKL